MQPIVEKGCTSFLSDHQRQEDPHGGRFDYGIIVQNGDGERGLAKGEVGGGGEEELEAFGFFGQGVAHNG